MTNVQNTSVSNIMTQTPDTSLLNFKRNVSKKNPWLVKYINRNMLLNVRLYTITKTAMDILLIGVATPFLLPLFLFIALLIKLEDPKGSVIFKQERTGRNGKRFDMYKFRTMVYNAEALKQDYAHLNELQWPDFKITNDPRITKVGKILRSTSLDELPQLLNVLNRSMSLVGPRPTSFGSDTYNLWQTERLDVLPGITGLWQIIGRASMEFSDRVHLDIFYIEKRCLLLDIEILFRTIWSVISRDGAH